MLKELEKSGNQQNNCGIFILTSDNFKSEWINFEAGAIWKSVKSSILNPLLFDLDPNDIKGPLNMFQCTNFNIKEMRALIKQINQNAGSDSIGNKDLMQKFDNVWKSLRNSVSRLIKKAKLELGEKILTPLAKSENKLLIKSPSEQLIDEFTKLLQQLKDNPMNFKIFTNLSSKVALLLKLGKNTSVKTKSQINNLLDLYSTHMSRKNPSYPLTEKYLLGLSKIPRYIEFDSIS